MATSTPQAFFWDSLRDFTMDRYLFQREYTFIKRILAAQPPGVILEICCGSGRLTLPMQKLGRQVIGLDLSAVPLSLAHQSAPTLSLVRADSLKLPFSDSSIGCVVAIQCLGDFCHQPFLQETYRVLRPGGLFIFQTVNRANYKRLLRNIGDRTEHHRPSDNFSTREILQATTHYGFTVHAVHGYNWGPFYRHSNSRWVPAAEFLERVLHLDRLYYLSPWVLIAARKPGG